MKNYKLILIGALLFLFSCHYKVEYRMNRVDIDKQVFIKLINCESNISSEKLFVSIQLKFINKSDNPVLISQERSILTSLTNDIEYSKGITYLPDNKIEKESSKVLYFATQVNDERFLNYNKKKKAIMDHKLILELYLYVNNDLENIKIEFYPKNLKKLDKEM